MTLVDVASVTEDEVVGAVSGASDVHPTAAVSTTARAMIDGETSRGERFMTPATLVSARFGSAAPRQFPEQ